MAHKKRRPFWPFGLFIFAALLAIDQYTKHVIITTLLPNMSRRVTSGLWFTYLQNTGTNWGVLNGSPVNGLFIWVSIIAFGLLLYFFDKFETTFEKIAYTLILVGLWGNLLDRGLQGFVVDFIDLHWWPVFNIADASICVGIIVFLLEQWKRSKKKS